MKTNKLAYLGLAFSSVLVLGGCSSLEKNEQGSVGIRQDILKSFDENKNSEKLSLKIKDYIQVEKPVLITETKKEARFNLLVNKAPVDALLQSLVDGTLYSLVTPEELSGNITLNLKNVTAFDVLETLKNVYHYDYEIHDKRIIVYPQGIRTKVFVMNHLVGKRKGNSELRVSSGSLTETVVGNNNSTNGNNSNNNSSSIQSTSTKVSTSVDSDFWKDIQFVLKALVSSNESTVVVSPDTNTIIVKALPKEINEIEKYLRKIQAIVDRQVVIEAKLIEVELKNGVQAGINWATFRNGNNSRASIGFGQSNSLLAPSGVIGTSEPTEVATIPGQNLAIGALNQANSVFSLAFQTSNFASILNFLETQGNLQVLSSPRIATLNNQKAILKVGTDEFFITNVTTTSTSTSAGTTNTPSVTTQPFFSGIALDITPQIDENGMVTMHVHPSVSEVSTVVKNINLGTLGSIVLPLASSTISETDSIVKVESNKIVAIGGLMKQYSRKDRSQLPGMADTPVVGNAFKSIDNELRKYELVILIKPQVITSQTDWETNMKEIRNRLAEFDPPSKDIIVNSTQKIKDK